MNLLDFRKPSYVIQEEVLSWSGKYKGFYGHHYHQNVLCHVVGVIRMTDGQITARHYNEKQPKTFQPKAEAIAYWNELREGLTRAPETEEQDDNQIPGMFERW